MKRIIALSSFLLLLLMIVLPAGVSHAASTNAQAVQVTGITFFMENGQKINAVKSGDNFTLDLVGDANFGDQVVDRVEITSNTAARLSVVPSDFDYSQVAPFTKEDLDIQFVNGVAVLDTAKAVAWSKRINGEDYPVEEEDSYLFTIGELRDVLLPAISGYFGYGEQSPYVFPGYVTDKDGNESTLTLTITTEGWKQINKKWYYLDSYGEPVTGWLLDGGTWFYLGEDGVMKTGWQYVGGKWYFLNSSGAMATGYVKSSGKLYILDQSGAMLTGTGWVKSGNDWYYLEKGDTAKTGWVKSGNKWYYLNPTSGVMQTGWAQVNGTWYFLNANGEMSTGWAMVNNKWYFFNTSGAMKTGWVKDKGTWYFLNVNGDMATGWALVNNKWYFFNASGVMKTGWVLVSNKWYYLYSDGHMASNTKIGSYNIGKDGAWIQ